MSTLTTKLLFRYIPSKHGVSFLYRRPFSQFAGTKPKVAVFYQALEPPVIGGVRKPKKPGGYQDSGADIAYNLSRSPDVSVLTPKENPSPTKEGDWCFPDAESGLVSAIEQGATHFWMNTILFASHPLQTSTALSNKDQEVFVVGQPPNLVEVYDDKARVNDFLRSCGSNFLLPKAVCASQGVGVEKALQTVKLDLPVVAKPIRGRGSHGVKLCNTKEELLEHADALFKESPIIMIEQYLSGEEATITTLPPSANEPKYNSLPPIVRFNHQNGIAPYNGVVAVTQNSRIPTAQEINKDSTFGDIMQMCNKLAESLGVTAPIRVDVRRINNGDDVEGSGKGDSRFAIFDVNMKPNMTGPGRPGRDDQASLTAMAAEAVGWSYSELLRKILGTAKSLREVRKANSAITGK